MRTNIGKELAQDQCDRHCRTTCITPAARSCSEICDDGEDALTDSWWDDQLADVMTGNVIRIGSDASLHEAQKLLVESRLTRLVVTNKSGRLLGIVTRRDMVRFLTQDKSGRPLETMRVREAMSAPVVTLRPIESLVDAARVMIKKASARLLLRTMETRS